MGETLNKEASLKEAEVYRSMGLLFESLGVYKRLLAEASDLDASTQEEIRGKIGQLKKQIVVQEKSNSHQISDKERSIIKKTLTSEEDVQNLLDSAFAFKELGLYEEAILEYVKLARRKLPLEKLVPDMVQCFLHLESPVSVLEQIAEGGETEAGEKGRRMESELTLRLGVEIEKRGHKQLSRELYVAASDLDPANAEASNHLSRLRAELAKKPEAPEPPDPGTQDPGPAQPNGVSKIKEKRREERVPARVPEFLSVEFTLEEKRGGGQTYHFPVLNYSAYGFGFLVPEEQRVLSTVLRPGDKIRDMTFFARWAMIKVDAVVRHVTSLEEGEHKGHYVIGVESEDLLDNSPPGT